MPDSTIIGGPIVVTDPNSGRKYQVTCTTVIGDVADAPSSLMQSAKSQSFRTAEGFAATPAGDGFEIRDGERIIFALLDRKP